MSSLNPLAAPPQQAPRNPGVGSRRGPEARATAYERGSNLVRSIGTNIKESTVAKLLQMPGIHRPLLAGAAATAFVSSMGPVSMGITDLVLRAFDAQRCSASALDLFSRWHSIGGLLGTAVGLVAPGKVASEDDDRELDRAAGAGLAGGLLGSLASEIAITISRGGFDTTDGDSALCVLAQIPVYNAALSGVAVVGTAVAAGLVAAPFGIAAVQGHKFYKSAAALVNHCKPADEVFDADPPDHLMDKITYSVIDDAVRTPYGHDFGRKALERTLVTTRGRCPMTRRPLSMRDVRPNAELQAEIDQWKSEHRV